MSAAYRNIDVDRAAENSADSAFFDHVLGWLEAAREVIDGTLGSGAADKQPALVGALVIACAIDYLAESAWTRLAMEQNP